MKHSRKKYDAASSVSSSQWYGHKVKESGDAERCLHVHHRKGGGRTQRTWGERCVHSCAAARREEPRHRKIGRHGQYTVLELHRGCVLEGMALRTASASGGGKELVHGRREAPTHQRKLVVNEASVEPSDECTCAERCLVFGRKQGGVKTNQIRR